ncbi:MAG: HEPN domain-containing protein [Nitrospiraceae bacterium]|nr:MAG: HEPN domain-containing protein [Nitrospiraceae bacterium]
MADPKIVREWFSKADEDLNFAKHNLAEGNTFHAQICFHFQPAAEKYLKSFIVAYDLEFEKMHNLINLLKICSKKEPSLNSLMDQCELLNTAYIETRYPVHWPTDYTRNKALNMQGAAEKIAQVMGGLLTNGGYL